VSNIGDGPEDTPHADRSGHDVLAIGLLPVNAPIRHGALYSWHRRRSSADPRRPPGSGLPLGSNRTDRREPGTRVPPSRRPARESGNGQNVSTYTLRASKPLESYVSPTRVPESGTRPSHSPCRCTRTSSRACRPTPRRRSATSSFSTMRTVLGQRTTKVEHARVRSNRVTLRGVHA
jgi:hypothetical protein